MNSKTDKNFIYDYLIHLDSYLLHGVAEVGAPQQKSSQNNPVIKKNLCPPFQNVLSPIAFINLNQSQGSDESSIFNPEEFQLFHKILKAMGINPEDIYLTSVHKSENTVMEADTNNLSLLENELSVVSSQYIVCLGSLVAKYFSKDKIEGYHLINCWQELSLFGKDRILITIPSITEMLKEPNHKKSAWAQLKKVADQIQTN